MSKKKEQEKKFNEYSINTDDAWEIDDRTMTLKIIDNIEEDDLGISKPIEKISTAGGIYLLLSIEINNLLFFFLVSKSKPSNNNRRIDDQLKPYRHTNNHKANHPKVNSVTMIDINQQKDSKFKQIFAQSTVDLSKN